MESSVHPHRRYSERQSKAEEREYQEKVETSIAAERSWLDGVEGERAGLNCRLGCHSLAEGIRIGGPTEEDNDEPGKRSQNQYVDEHVLRVRWSAI